MGGLATTEETRKGMEAAAEELYPTLKARLEACGVAFVTRNEGAALCVKYGISKGTIRFPYRMCRDRLGKDVIPTGYTGNTEELVYLLGVMRDYSDTVTEEISAEFQKKYRRYPRHTRIAAESILKGGTHKHRNRRDSGGEHEPETLRVPTEFQEALRVAQHVQALTGKIATREVQVERIEAEIKILNDELELYKPVLQSMRALTGALATMRGKAGEVAIRPS